MQTWIRFVVVVLALIAAARVERAQAIAAAPAPAFASAMGRHLPGCVNAKDMVNIDWRNAPNAVPNSGVPLQPVIEVYSVPLGSHFVVIEASMDTSQSVNLCLRLAEIDGPTTRVKQDKPGAYFGPVPSGLVFAPGSKVAFIHDTSCSALSVHVRYAMTGYLQSMAGPGCLKATNIVNLDWRSAPAAGSSGLSIGSSSPGELWTVPTGKRFVLQQYLGTPYVQVSQSLAGQHTFRRDLSFAWGASPAYLQPPFGLVFEPGSKVMLWSTNPGTQLVTYDIIGYLEDA